MTRFMKKGVYYLLVISVLIVVNSCRKALKDVNDYVPEIKTVSATIQTDGTLLLLGEIVSEGDAAIEYTGFCYATSTNPNMVSNQIMVTTNGTNFSATFPCSYFDIDSVYYFRSWATNRYGYSYGNTISLDSIVATAVTPPCSNVMNTVNIGGGQPTATYSSIGTPVNNIGYWEFQAQTGSGPILNISFGSALTTRIYTTTTSTSPGSGEMNIYFYDGWISGTLSDGSSVYVNTIGTGTYDISICNAPWLNNSTTNYFNTRLTVQQ